MNSRNAGFSLIEVLVALTILALATGSLLGIFSAAARNTAVATQLQQALAIAENQVSVLDGFENYRPGTTEGVDGDRYHWTVELEETISSDRIVRTVRPIQLRVTVDWQDGPRRRSLQLNSTRLARAL